MKKIKYTGDQYKDMAQMVRGFLFNTWDSYKEWLDFTYPTMLNEKKITDEGLIELGQSDYYLIKQELEELFERRETITKEEVYEYVKGIINPVKRSIYIYIIAIYQDFYKQDEDYKEKLMQETIKYFEITETELEMYRV